MVIAHLPTYCTGNGSNIVAIEWLYGRDTLTLLICIKSSDSPRAEAVLKSVCFALDGSELDPSLSAWMLKLRMSAIMVLKAELKSMKSVFTESPRTLQMMQSIVEGSGCPPLRPRLSTGILFLFYFFVLQL